MPTYTKSERTARKARKQARLEAAADVEQAQVQGQAAMQARLEQLLEANAQASCTLGCNTANASLCHSFAELGTTGWTVNMNERSKRVMNICKGETCA